MSDPADDVRATQQLDEMLAGLQREEPDSPLRRDAVWNRIDAARSVAAQPPRSGGASHRWMAAAAVVLLTAGTVLVSRSGRDAALNPSTSVAGKDPLFKDAASVVSAWAESAAQRSSKRSQPNTQTDSSAGSLGRHSALLLAATRVQVEKTPVATERARLLRDVEYVLAQMVEGVGQDDVERELTLAAIRDRRLVDRLAEGVLQ